VLVVSGNHDLPAGNKAALERTPFGLLKKLGIFEDLEEDDYEYDSGNLDLIVTGCGFDFKTDTEDGAYQFEAGEPSQNTVYVHVVHSMLMAASPTFPMRHTLINQVETDADIIISGHYHEGFGIIRRKDGKLFINPGALCRLSASKAEMERAVQVALLTIRSKTDFDAELIPLLSAQPAEEVLDREAIVEKVEHENWLDSFFESLDKEGEVKFLGVREIVDSIASREKILPVVKEETLKRIGEAREKLGLGRDGV
jgi:exonuclease SbcD